MATNPLIACDPTTSWYDFTYPLSWSNKCEIAEVLSDIPLISVGTLVFGISALLLAMKRVTLSAVWLFVSTLLAFVAAVLDLGQTLADGMAVNVTFRASETVIRVREILFALSIGFRFLFYWTYVAEPPRKDLSAASAQNVQSINILTLECTHPLSRSWTPRWGLPGRFLDVGLLAAIITITVLQIVWRVVPQFHQYSNVYGTDAALELLVSFLLFLRLLLNTVNSPQADSTLIHTFRECLAPISGLLINIAIGVGGLLCFAFTESTVGRILQAFEVFIIIVFVVVTAFLRHHDVLLSATSFQDRRHKDVDFTLPEPVRGSTFRITPPLIETPRMSTIFATSTHNGEVLRRSARRSLNRVSSWVSSKISRNRVRREEDGVRLWNAEKVKADPPYTESIHTELRASIVSLTQDPKGLAERMEGSTHSRRIQPHSPAGDHTVPLQARTSLAQVSSIPSPVMEASPVYSLDGIRLSTSTPDSQTSIEELLRQQSQLDRSIEALKLFSVRTSVNPSHANGGTSHGSVELNRSPSTGQRTVSSDVSLSNFPVPPWLASPVPSPSSSRPPSLKRIRGNRRVRLAVTQPTPVQDPGIPHSPLGGNLSAEAGKSFRPDCGETLSNVTSFIDGFAIPGEPRSMAGNQEKSSCPTGGQTIQTNSGMRKVPPRMLIPPRLSEVSPTVAELSPLTLSLSEGDSVNDSEPSSVKQYVRSSDHTCGTLGGVSPYPLTAVTEVEEKGVEMLQTEARLAQLGDGDSREGSVQVQGVFIRPRPPPLAIRSYTEQTCGVQLLADDR